MSELALNAPKQAKPAPPHDIDSRAQSEAADLAAHLDLRRTHHAEPRVPRLALRLSLFLGLRPLRESRGPFPSKQSELTQGELPLDSTSLEPLRLEDFRSLGSQEDRRLLGGKAADMSPWSTQRVLAVGASTAKAPSTHQTNQSHEAHKTSCLGTETCSKGLRVLGLKVSEVGLGLVLALPVIGIAPKQPNSSSLRSTQQQARSSSTWTAVVGKAPRSLYSPCACGAKRPHLNQEGSFESNERESEQS